MRGCACVCNRQCFCNSGNYTGAQSTEFGQLLGGLAGGGRLVGGMPGDATRCGLRGKCRINFAQIAVRLRQGLEE